MAMFWRKEDKEEELEERVGKVSSKKFKDLNPENRKKRKEPDKPWGKSERILVLVILLATILISAILGLSARNYKLDEIPRFTLPRINWNIFESETVIIEKKP